MIAFGLQEAWTWAIRLDGSLFAAIGVSWEVERLNLPSSGDEP
jgi:hypothetical protein